LLRKAGISIPPRCSFYSRREEIFLKEVEASKAEQNKLSASVPQVKKAGGDVQAIFVKVKALAAGVKDKEAELEKTEADIKAQIEVLPNMPDPDLVGGGKENNHPIYHFGKEPKFEGFKPKDHVELEESLGLIDYKRGAKISGSGCWMYTGLARSSSGRYSITSLPRTLRMAIPLFFRRTCSMSNRASPRVNSRSLRTMSSGSMEPSRANSCSRPLKRPL
jgi:hypothetical protein